MRLVVMSLCLSIALCTAANARTLQLEFHGVVSGVEDLSGGLKASIDALFPTGAPLRGRLSFDGARWDSILSPDTGEYRNAISALVIETNGLSMTSTNGFISVVNDYGAKRTDFVSYHSNAAAMGLTGDMARGNTPSQFLLTFEDEAGAIFEDDTLPAELRLEAFTDVIGKLGYAGASPVCWKPSAATEVCNPGAQHVSFEITEVSLRSMAPIPVGGTSGFLMTSLILLAGLRHIRGRGSRLPARLSAA